MTAPSYSLRGLLGISPLIAALLFWTQPAANLSAQEASSEVVTTKKIKLVSWNLEWFPGGKKDRNPTFAVSHAALVEKELLQLNPDVFLAQEVRDWQSFADLVRAVTGLQPAVVSAFSNEETGEYWEQQVTIASKLPVFAAWSESWKEGVMKPRRGFSAAALTLPGTNKLLLVYSLHLKSNSAADDAEAKLNFVTRNESIRQLLEHVTLTETVLFKDRIAGVVVGGDLNTNHDGQFADQVVSMLEAGGFHNTWAGVEPKDRHTWRGNSRFDPTTFDYFFTKGLGTPTAKLMPANEKASDHSPLMLEITLPQ